MRKRAHARHAHRVGRNARGRCRSAFREQRRKLFTMGAKVLGIASCLGAPYKMIGKTFGVGGRLGFFATYALRPQAWPVCDFCSCFKGKPQQEGPNP